MPDPLQRFAPAGGALPPIDLTAESSASAQAAEQQARLIEAVKLRALALAKMRGMAGQSNAAPEGMAGPPMKEMPAMPYVQRDVLGGTMESTQPFPPLEPLPPLPPPQPPQQQQQQMDPRMARMMALRSMPQRQGRDRSKEVQAP